MIAVRYASGLSGVLVRSTIHAVIHPMISASTALPAAKASEFALLTRKRRLPNTASKLARLHSLPCESTMLALSRQERGQDQRGEHDDQQHCQHKRLVGGEASPQRSDRGIGGQCRSILSG